MILAAGKLDKRVKLYEPTQNIVVGTHTPTYNLKYTVWANVRQLTLRELMKTDVELQSETYTVVMRYIKGITNKWRVELPNGNYYRILTINTEGSTGSMTIGIELDNSIVQETSS